MSQRLRCISMPWSTVYSSEQVSTSAWKWTLIFNSHLNGIISDLLCWWDHDKNLEVLERQVCYLHPMQVQNLIHIVPILHLDDKRLSLKKQQVRTFIQKVTAHS